MAVREINVISGEQTTRDYTPEELVIISDHPPAQLSKDQRRRQILDSVGCFNQVHFDKDWALLESERERLGTTEAQAYSDNVTYRALADARAALAEIDAE